MEGLSTGQIALIVLAAGLVIVFAVLICLILIIRLYGSVIQSAQKGRRKKEEPAAPQPNAALPLEEPQPALSVQPAAQGEISPEIIAAISAAVYALYGTETPILSVRRCRRTGVRSVWGQAGVLRGTHPF